MPSHGSRTPLHGADIDDVFARASRATTGPYRAMAQRGLPGRVIGGFKYFGTRPDDPNDIVPHEHRRELRALQVFGAWTNLVDMKAGNTLDTVITENGRASCATTCRTSDPPSAPARSTRATATRDTSTSTRARRPSSGSSRSASTSSRGRRSTTREHPEIGRFTANGFEPEKWTPRVPAAALLRVRADDTLWAALRVMAFTDEHIRAAAKTGQYTDPAAEKLLGDVLIARRDKIARVYTANVNPLVKFSLDGTGALTFENPAVRAHIADAPKGGYQAAWARFDNGTARLSRLAAPTTGRERLQAPGDLPQGEGVYIKASVSAVDGPHAAWATPVDVYFRRTGGQWQLVGVERLPNTALAAPAKK